MRYNPLETSSFSLPPSYPVSFLQPQDPDGADDRWFTADDGFHLASCSREGTDTLAASTLPADANDLDSDGNTTELLPLDLGMESRIQGGGPKHGAYETIVPVLQDSFAAAVFPSPVCAHSPLTLATVGASMVHWGAAVPPVPLSPDSSGVYTLWGLTLNGCPDSTTVEIVVQPGPTVAVTKIASNRLEAQTSNGATLQWLLDGLALPDTGYMLTMVASGTYSAVATGPNGCTDTSTVFSFVENDPVAAQASITLYPNPASTAVVIETSDGLQMVEIFSLRGERIMAESFGKAPQTAVIATDFPAGLYLLRVNEIQTFKLLIIK